MTLKRLLETNDFTLTLIDGKHYLLHKEKKLPLTEKQYSRIARNVSDNGERGNKCN